MKPKSNGPIHYGWIICITGTAVVFACLGLGRFSLGMLLPSMGATLSLSYSQMGLISTGNFAGYMGAVILAGVITNRMGARRATVAGLVLVGASILLISGCAAFGTVLALYVVTGFGSGLANVPLMGLISQWFFRSARGCSAGIVTSGSGFAIIFTGLFIPWVNQTLGPEGWRTSWLVLGGISLVVALAAGVLLRNRPGDMGLVPVGRAAMAAGSDAHKARAQKKMIGRDMFHLGAIYALFGATYSVYVTFIVTVMVNERNLGEDAAGLFWAVVGGLSIFSGPLFGWISDRLGRRVGMMLVYALFTLSYASVPLSFSGFFLYASIVIFGLVAWAMPTIMSATVADVLGPERAVKAFGFITLFFGAGQLLGPWMAGGLANATGSFDIAFWLCAFLTACAAALAFFLKPPDKCPVQ